MDKYEFLGKMQDAIVNSGSSGDCMDAVEDLIKEYYGVDVCKYLKGPPEESPVVIRTQTFDYFSRITVDYSHQVRTPRICV